MAEKHLCPVCGLTTFSDVASFEICEVCDWQDDLYQLNRPDEDGGANNLSLNQARAKYYAEKANNTNIM